METKFKLKNNTERSFGFAGKICIAGSGNPTPPKAAEVVIEGKPFSLPPLFELTEPEMFRSFRGVLAAMNEVSRFGQPAIQVFVDGVTSPLTPKDLEGWAADWRDRQKLPEPADHADHVREAERAMNRREDPVERARRLEKEEERSTMIQAVSAATVEAVLAALGGLSARAAPQPPAAPPAPPSEPVRGRNDEAPEATVPEATAPQAPVPGGRARPRS